MAERKRLSSRADDIEQIANKLSHILTNFSMKITKIRSDYDLFEERVSKQLQQFDQVRSEINNLGR